MRKKKQIGGGQAGVPPLYLGETENAKMYPLIYFKLQPEIAAACDEFDRLGTKTLTSEIVERTTDSIYGNVCKKYPDLAVYAQEYEKDVPVATYAISNEFGIQIRRRGIFLDLIAFLLLSEFFFRRRRRR